MSITTDCVIGDEVVIPHPELVNLYGCTIGNKTKIASFVEIQRGVELGHSCKVEAFAFIPTGVTIGNGVFIGPHACFTNDKHPRATDENLNQLTADQWKITKTVVEDRVSIGANATIVCGVTLAEGTLVAAGAVVTKSTNPNEIVAGCPARVIGWADDK